MMHFGNGAMENEPLHLVWWNLAWACTLTTSRSLLNVKGQGHIGSFVYFLCAWYCSNQLAWIHEMLHRYGLLNMQTPSDKGHVHSRPTLGSKIWCLSLI